MYCQFLPKRGAPSVEPGGAFSDELFHDVPVRRFVGVSEGAIGNSHDDIVNIGAFEHRGRA